MINFGNKRKLILIFPVEEFILFRKKAANEDNEQKLRSLDSIKNVGINHIQSC